MVSNIISAMATEMVEMDTSERLAFVRETQRKLIAMERDLALAAFAEEAEEDGSESGWSGVDSTTAACPDWSEV